jgi:CRP/FNR family transcriptional regulator, dissimilatory nitrate respiration regulator
MLCRSAIPMGELLLNLPLFNGLDEEELECIRTEFGQLDVSRGTTLYRRGDPCSGIHVVVSGQVKVALGTADGAEKVVELAGPGQTLGETAVFLDRPHKTSAETLSDCRLLYIAKENVFAAVRNHPGFAQRIIASLSHRLDRFISDLESLTLHSGTERVVSYLLSRLDGAAARTHVAVMLPASKGVIASRLSLTQEHFSRILHDLTSIDLIRVDGRYITIPNVDQLRARAA